MLIEKIMEVREDITKLKDPSERAENAPRAAFLAVLIGDCTRATKTPSDDAVVSIIKKMIENCKVVLGDTIKVGTNVIKNTATQEQKDAAAAEIKILEEFLPQQMTEEDIVAAIQKAKDGGATDMKGIMAYLKANHIGLYDGKLASDLVKKGV